MSKVNKFCDVSAESIKYLLSLSVGELREKLAYEDAIQSLEDFIADDLDGFDADDYEVDEDEVELYDEDDYEDDEEDWDDDDEPYEDSKDDEDSNDDYGDDEYDDPEVDADELPSDQRALAYQIAEDIRANKYSAASLAGLYSEDFIAAVVNLV